jgi:MoaA/NifB/PqqE/SkfB family radical SAM enzyme
LCRSFKEALLAELDDCRQFAFAKEIPILEDSDFAAVERVCESMNATVMIGSSDGRRIAQKLGIPLIRCAFPIHDHVGGQRVRILGFEGSLNLLDLISNEMIDNTETGFRKALYDKFYDKSTLSTPEDKTAAHPCFGEHACKNARLHLPVAPKCDIQCNYCLRNFDCMNESRPGVSSKILTPREGLERYIKLKDTMPNLTVVGIAGPGDALPNFRETYETLRLIRDFDPDITFCIATNGLLLPLYVSELKDLGVSHVTVTVNAVDPVIGAEIYHHINYMGKTYTGVEGASILLANQLAGIRMLVDSGIVCKVNCVTLKGVNDAHIFEVTQKMAQLGVHMTNIMPHIPVKGSAFENLDRMSGKEIDRLRESCGVNIKQMTHCRQCRSDAAGTLDEDISLSLRENKPSPAQAISCLRFAVATKSGAIVDMHFGHANEFYIYDSDGVDTRFVETRKVSKYCDGPECGDKDDKWDSVIRAVSDCRAVLSLRIGIAPEKHLNECGIDAITTYERVETAVKEAAVRYKEQERSA